MTEDGDGAELPDGLYTMIAALQIYGECGCLIRLSRSDVSAVA